MKTVAFNKVRKPVTADAGAVRADIAGPGTAHETLHHRRAARPAQPHQGRLCRTRAEDGRRAPRVARARVSARSRQIVKAQNRKHDEARARPPRRRVLAATLGQLVAGQRKRIDHYADTRSRRIVPTKYSVLLVRSHCLSRISWWG